MLFGITGMDWRLRVCWLLVLLLDFVGLMCFGEGGLRIKHRTEVLSGYEWRMGMLWMLILRDPRENLIRSGCYLQIN